MPPFTKIIRRPPFILGPLLEKSHKGYLTGLLTPFKSSRTKATFQTRPRFVIIASYPGDSVVDAGKTAPSLLVTKSSPSSGGGVRKIILRPHFRLGHLLQKSQFNGHLFTDLATFCKNRTTLATSLLTWPPFAKIAQHWPPFY